jgi:flavin-dependent dehydrogenase
MSYETKAVRHAIVVTGAISGAITAALAEKLGKGVNVVELGDDPDGKIRADILATQQLEQLDRLEIRQLHDSTKPPFSMSGEGKQKAQWKQERGRGKKMGRR